MRLLRYKHTQQRGFIALVSAILLSTLLLLFVEAEGLAGYLAHQAVTDEQSYRVAQQAAFSCAEFAISRLDADPLRFQGIGTTTIQLDAAACEIVSASTTNDSATVITRGESVRNSVPIFFSAIRASSSDPFRLISWEEY